MPPPTPDPPPGLPSFGKLGTTSAFLPIPVGDVVVKLTRVLGQAVVYLPPPVGQGLKGLRWERDQFAGTPTSPAFSLKADTSDLRAAVSLSEWRSQIRASFPDGAVTNRKLDAVRRLAEFARGLLTFTADLHRQKWRLGLIDTDNLYLIERPPTSTEPARTEVFLPDLGFAWVGTISLAAPNWLRTEDARDNALWSEDRNTRQYAAPLHYQRDKALAGAWNELVGRDLRVIARLIKYALTGDVTTREPAAAAKCPVWKVIRNAEAGKYEQTDTGSAAENMLADLLKELRAPIEPSINPGGSLQPTRRSKRLPILLGVLLVAGGTLAGWWFLVRDNLDGKGTDAQGVTASGTSVTPQEKLAETQVLEATDLVAKGRAAAELAKINPNHPLVAKTRQELLDEIQRQWNIAQAKGHNPLITRELVDALKQLPESP